MTTTVRFSNLKIKAGDFTTMKGKVRLDASSFIIKLGRNDSNLILHLKFRYVCHAGFNTKVIELNSMKDGVRGEVVRKLGFPFRDGEELRMTILFNTQSVKVYMQKEEDYITIPNRLGLDSAEFLSVEGDFRLNRVKFY